MRLFWILLLVTGLLAGGWIYTARVAQRSASTAVAAEKAARDAAKAAAEAQAKSALPKQADATAATDNTARESGTAKGTSKPEAEATAKPEAKPETKPEAAPAAAPASQDEPKGGQVSGSFATDPATAQSGVVRVSLTGSDGKPLATRAGFQMTADLVVSPAHLLDSAVSGLVTTAGGLTIPIIGTVTIDQSRDIAILRLARAVPGSTVLRFATAEVPADSQQFLLPLKGSPTVMATVLGYRTDTVQGRRVQIKASLPSNPVGMPLVSDRGEVVGMVTGKDPSGAALVASAAEILALPRGQVTPLTMTAVKAPPAAAPATPAPSAAQNNQAPPEVASEAKIEKKDDGSILVDDKFIVKGEGTKEKPYEVTWEMLISAQDVYDPRKGQKKLPGRVMMLDGKWVKLTGYVAFTLYVEEPKELLSMLNQWDGCCIGVPPTPYDAVEVRLADKVSKDDRLATFGVVTGKLSVKPYLAGDWLVGLYLMDDATFQAKRFGGFGS
jgi:hypothetical protein